MNISLRQIRAFVAVARTSSFTRAADVLHLAQPTLTVQVRNLEEALQLRLFDRDTRTVSLTRVGQELLPVFQRMLRDLDSVVVDAHEIAAMRRGVVRIAALPSIAAGLLPETIQSFRQKHLGASFVVRDVIADKVIEHLGSEDVDLAIMGGDIKHRGVDILLDVADKMHLVFPADHPIGRQADLSMEDLANLPLVLMDPATSVRTVVDAAFLKGGFVIRPTCEPIYMMTAVAMVRAGLGLTILPASAREINVEPTLRSRPIDLPDFSRSITVIKKSGRTLPPLSQAFAEHLMGAMA
jgi:DNA-binding transcriptional LysR family regulator